MLFAQKLTYSHTHFHSPVIEEKSSKRYAATRYFSSIFCTNRLSSPFAYNSPYVNEFFCFIFIKGALNPRRYEFSSTGSIALHPLFLIDKRYFFFLMLHLTSVWRNQPPNLSTKTLKTTITTTKHATNLQITNLKKNKKL